MRYYLTCKQHTAFYEHFKAVVYFWLGTNTLRTFSDFKQLHFWLRTNTLSKFSDFRKFHFWLETNTLRTFSEFRQLHFWLLVYAWRATCKRRRRGRWCCRKQPWTWLARSKSWRTELEATTTIRQCTIRNLENFLQMLRGL